MFNLLFLRNNEDCRMFQLFLGESETLQQQALQNYDALREGKITFSYAHDDKVFAVEGATDLSRIIAIEENDESEKKIYLFKKTDNKILKINGSINDLTEDLFGWNLAEEISTNKDSLVYKSEFGFVSPHKTGEQAQMQSIILKSFLPSSYSIEKPVIEILTKFNQNDFELSVMSSHRDNCQKDLILSYNSQDHNVHFVTHDDRMKKNISTTDKTSFVNDLKLILSSDFLSKYLSEPQKLMIATLDPAKIIFTTEDIVQTLMDLSMPKPSGSLSKTSGSEKPIQHLTLEKLQEMEGEFGRSPSNNPNYPAILGSREREKQKDCDWRWTQTPCLLIIFVNLTINFI